MTDLERTRNITSGEVSCLSVSLRQPASTLCRPDISMRNSSDELVACDIGRSKGGERKAADWGSSLRLSVDLSQSGPPNLSQISPVPDLSQRGTRSSSLHAHQIPGGARYNASRDQSTRSITALEKTAPARSPALVPASQGTGHVRRSQTMAGTACNSFGNSRSKILFEPSRGSLNDPGYTLSGLQTQTDSNIL